MMSAARAVLSLLLLGSWAPVSFGLSGCNIPAGVVLPQNQDDCTAAVPGSIWNEWSGHCHFVVKGDYTSEQCSKTVCAEHKATGSQFFKKQSKQAVWPGALADSNGGWIGGIFEHSNDADACESKGYWRWANGCSFDNTEIRHSADVSGCCDLCLYLDTPGQMVIATSCNDTRNCICEYPTEMQAGGLYDTVMTAHMAGCSGSTSLVARLGAAAAFVSVTRMLM
mmetsp:Transcript_90054/g.226589  ORF Transcript_90054/g.226589 Transcript_90054/m.226589 type:complete len:224 (-) Transcript_90054:106-777(-)